MLVKGFATLSSCVGARDSEEPSCGELVMVNVGNVLRDAATEPEA